MEFIPLRISAWLVINTHVSNIPDEHIYIYILKITVILSNSHQVRKKHEI